MINENEAPERIWAKVRTFSRFYGVNTETEVRREWCENYATPEIARTCGAVEYTRATLSDAKDKRIDELEAWITRKYPGFDINEAMALFGAVERVERAKTTIAELKNTTATRG